MVETPKIPTSLDKNEFEKLFKEFFPSLTLFARKYVPDLDTAKEIVHNVFLNLWEKREEIDTSKSLKSYLFTSVHNRSLNYIRDERKFDREEHYMDQWDKEESIEVSDHLETQELESRIMDALSHLPEKCREIFKLNRFEGMKYQEIADKLDISVKTVESQMSKALKILREKLVDYLTVLLIFMINHLN